MGVAHSVGSSARTQPAATDRTEKGPVSFYSVKPAGASSLKRTLAQRETTSGCSKATQTTTLKNAFMECPFVGVIRTAIVSHATPLNFPSGGDCAYFITLERD